MMMLRLHTLPSESSSLEVGALSRVRADERMGKLRSIKVSLRFPLEC
jgi:hypothetical protein